MLAHLNSINVHHVSLATGWHTIATCELPKKVDRLRRGDISEEQCVELGGRVAINRNGTITALDFVGHQTIEMTKRLWPIKNSDAWPTMHLRDEEGLKAIQLKEKASPQGAVMLYRQPSVGASILTLDWAVFLPVGGRQREQVQLGPSDTKPGLATDFHLVLHGYFFLDAGRQSIEAISDPLLGNPPKDEADVRRAWNTTLRDELVLPTIPAAVAAAAQKLNLAHTELWALCEAVQKTSVWVGHTKIITSQTRFVCELRPTGPCWQLVTSKSTLRPLLRPPVDERDRPWIVLPGLTEFQNDRNDSVLVMHDAPHLTTQDSLNGWLPDEVADLIAKAPVTVFKRRAHVAYLASFLDTFPETSRNSAVCDALFGLLRNVLSGEGGASLVTSCGQAVIPLLARISRNQLLFLPERATAPEILSELNSATSSLLILPSSLEPPGFAGTELNATTAIDLLVALHSLIETATEAVTDAASRAAAEILSRTGRHISELINSSQFEILPVFRVRNWKAERMVSVSYKDLILAEREYRLFLAIPGETLPRLLQQVLVDFELLSIDRETAASISLNAKPISSESCLLAVSRASRLAGPGPRAKLLAQVRTADPTASRAAFRFLCHGVATARSRMEPLLRTNTSELGELISSLLHRRGEGWRVLPESISDALTGGLARVLGVQNWDDSEIAEQLGDASDDDLALTRNISDEAKLRLLLAVHDRALWRRLPFHAFVDGHFGPVDHNAFLQSDYPLAIILAGTVRLVCRSLDQNLAAQQEKFVDPWGPGPLIATALEQPNLHRFSSAILDALDNIPDPLLAQFTDNLRGKPWLKLTSGPTRPEDILELPEDVAGEAERLLTNQGERTFVTAAMVPLEIRSRHAWNHIKRFIQTGGDALEGLALILEGDLFIVLVPDWGAVVIPIDDFVQLAASGFDLPLRGWPLFAATARHLPAVDIETRLLPKLRGSLSGDSLRTILQRISEYDKGVTDIQRQPARKVFAFYLQAALACREASSILSAIELPNQSGGWTSARQIATEGYGVVPTALIDTAFVEFFNRDTTNINLSPDRAPEARTSRFNNAAAQLRDFFNSWRHRVPMTPVGAFLALLGQDPAISEFASQCLLEGQRDLKSTLSLIGELRDRATIGPRFTEIRDRYQFTIALDRGSTVTLRAVTGDQFEAPRLDRIENLLVGDALSRRMHGNTVVLELRHIDVAAVSQADLLGALWAATDAILADVYVVLKGGRDRLREEFFEPFVKSDTVAITIARERAIEGLSEQLKDLPLAPESALAAAQRAVEDAWRHEAQSPSASSREGIAAAKRNLAAVIQSDPLAQQALLDAMRRKIDEQEYKPDRVPFELFQNADDALVENSAGVPRAGRVLVEVEEHCLRLVHWGRPLNDLGPDTNLGRQRNYDMDLQKLLKLGFSQKTFDPRTTGRFGLGFKSVYLVTEVPLIASRWIAVRIHGTVIPEPAREALRLVSQYQGEHSATVIELPRRADGPAPLDYAEEMRRSLGQLCVFAKAIRHITWRHAGGTFEVEWKPRQLADIDGIEIGKLAEDGQAYRLALVFRHATEALLLRLDAKGIKSLPTAVPTIWALAPTSERWDVGYLVNGQFRVDVGRSRLAGEFEENFERAAALGVRLGEQLFALFQASEDHWPELAIELGLANNSRAAFAAFWQSLFDVLSRGLSTGSPSAEFLGKVHKGHAGLATLVSRCPALPTSLNDASPRLVQYSQTLKYPTGALTGAALRRNVAVWPHAREILDSCIDKAVAERCVELGLPRIGEVRLRALLRRELGDDARVTETLAAQFGRSFDDVEMLVTDPHERADIETELRRCRFEAEDRSWQPVASLHARDTGNTDEELYLDFTPVRLVLNASYSADARRFFLLARARSGFGPQARTLADWARVSTSRVTQRAVLRYLLEGEKAIALANMLRERRPIWLNSSDTLADANLMTGFTPVEITRLRAALFPETLIQIQPNIQRPEPPEASRFLDAVHRWWTSTGPTLSFEYTERTYPNGFNVDALLNREFQDGRTSWFTLLALASFQTLGRTREEQHRNFLEETLRHPWWLDLAVRPDVNRDPLPWLQRMEAIAEDYEDDQRFLQWHRRLFDLYILARWLDTYSHLFLSLPDRIAQQGGRLSLRQLLQPITDPAMSGSGIWAPAINRTLGYGVCFVIRELARFNIFKSAGIEAYAWQPTLRLRNLLQWLGMDVDNETRADNSPPIWHYVRTQMDSTRARFYGAFDLPLQLLTTERFRQDRDDILREANIETRNLDEILNQPHSTSPDDATE